MNNDIADSKGSPQAKFFGPFPSSTFPVLHRPYSDIFNLSPVYRREGGALPCLSSNNSNSTVKSSEAAASILSPYFKRSAHTLYLNVERFVELFGFQRVGFLTLTFPDNVTDPREALRRFNSFNTGFLKRSSEFGEYICIKERQKRGAWHYHLLIALGGDIRSGFDIEQYMKWSMKAKKAQKKGQTATARTYSRRATATANDYLKSLWAVLRRTCKSYNFGRSEMLPLLSNKEAVARYLGKYISKHIGARKEEDHGLRLVNYSRGWIKNSVNFQWLTQNSTAWRRKLSVFGAYYGCYDLYELKETMGAGWAFKFCNAIREIVIPDSIVELKAIVNTIYSQSTQYLSRTVKNTIINHNYRENGYSLSSIRMMNKYLPGLEWIKEMMERTGASQAIKNGITWDIMQAKGCQPF